MTTLLVFLVAQTNPLQWIEIISQGGVLGLLLLILFSGQRKKWVWFWLYEDIKADRDYWRARAMEGLVTAEDAVDVAETAVTTRKGRRS